AGLFLESASALIDRMVADRKYHGKPIGQVQGAARQKILLHLEQIRAVAEDWLAATADDDGGSETTLAKAKLLQSLRSNLPGIVMSLKELSSHPHGSIHNSVHFAVANRLEALSEALRGAPLSTIDQITHSLIRLPGIPLTADLRPIESPSEIHRLVTCIRDEHVLRIDE